MLSRTRFRPQDCAIEMDDLTAIPSDGPVLFIVGIEQTHDSVCKRIRTRYPHSFIIAVGDETNRHYVRAALDEGANAALLSSISPPALISALYSVMNGRLIVIDDRLWSSDIQPRLEEQFSSPIQDTSSPIQNASPAAAAENAPRPVEPLSAREIAVLERIVRGDSNKHVARFFHIAEPTVKAHVKAIFRKTGASNRTQAATWALTHRLFDNVNIAPNLGIENWSSEIQPMLEEQLSPPIQDASPPIQNDSPWAVENDARTVEHLSAREIAILERIVRGDSNKHVAQFFNIAEPTVKAHVKAIFRKIGASNRTQAATLALTHRLSDSMNSVPHAPPLELQHGNDGDDSLQNRPSSSFRTNGNGTLKSGRAVS
jgi:two-component system nitrate/nitrite response regulator NarL